MLPVAIVGASGYTGLELLRIVLRHPELELVAATSEQRAGTAVGEAFLSLRGRVELRFESVDPASLAERAELAFTALPHAASAPTVRALRAAGVRVVDLSADFRLRDPVTYQRTYGVHGAPELLGEAVYGLPELRRDALRGAGLAAVAGCYPTSILLPLVPFLRAGLVEPALWIDSKSGASGAGRKLAERYLFAELDDDCFAYLPGDRHRHVPEIEQEASAAAGEPVRATFVPHLLPTVRGIATSIYARPRRPLGADEARELLAKTYGAERFVRVLPAGETPSLGAVRGANYCDVAAFADERTGALILLSALDNLVKGASGNAVQCANLMCGLPEHAGLLEAPLVP